MELEYRGLAASDTVDTGTGPVSNLYRVTPFMHVPDIAAAVNFFTDILSFECRYRQGSYAYVQREAAAFRLVENSGDDGAPPGNRRFCYYVDVRDVAAIAAELAPKASLLNDGDIYGPIDQIYGQRELMVVAPDGNLLVFGQDLTRG
ncbi:VOC family protein [Sphingomonas gei]|uniref:Bleomycin resistance protein n=1 Tax=Sphingomonas gei TaxID=1395960 RepID=A0A4V3QZF0_9SPHN|nr:VOC family protein [Sphingomonas gei]TGX53972.1 VOC family protein [Sphingomonas gei]